MSRIEEAFQRAAAGRLDLHAEHRSVVLLEQALDQYRLETPLPRRPRSRPFVPSRVLSPSRPITAPKERSASHDTPAVVSVEALRLAARLRATFSKGSHLIQFTGVREGEGVTPAANEVAYALAKVESQAVLLIDANLRVPGLHGASSASARPGLVDLIQGRPVLREAIQGTSITGLCHLPTGVAGADAVSLFSSPVWTRLLRDVREGFRFVIIDSPPLLSYEDSALIAQRVDGVVVVVAAGQHRHELIEAKRLLDGLKVILIEVMPSWQSGSGRTPDLNGQEFSFRPDERLSGKRTIFRWDLEGDSLRNGSS